MWGDGVDLEGECRGVEVRWGFCFLGVVIFSFFFGWERGGEGEGEFGGEGQTYIVPLMRWGFGVVFADVLYCVCWSDDLCGSFLPFR